MVNAKTVTYDPVGNTFSGTLSSFVSGSITIITRPNAQNPAYVLAVTDQGELRVFNKDGTLKWSTDSGITAITSAHVNNNAEVVTLSGTTVRMYGTTGSLVWTQTITNSQWVQIGTSDVAVAINTGVAATSGISWRSLTDGTQTQGVHGTVSNPLTSPVMPCACNQAGDIVVLNYAVSAAVTVRVEKFSKTGGRLFSVTYTPDGAAASGPTTLFISTSYDAAVTASSSNSQNANANNVSTRVFDGSLVTIGSVNINAAATWISRVNPVGSRVIFYQQNSTTARLITVSPFSTVTPTVAANVGNNRYAGDVSDEAIFFYALVDGSTRSYEDSVTESASYTGQGVANNMVSVIRNV